MLDWEVLRSKALAKAQIFQGTYPAIRFALSQLGDRHSFLRRANTVAANKVLRQGLGFRSVEGMIVLAYPTSSVIDGSIQPGEKIETIEGVP